MEMYLSAPHIPLPESAGLCTVLLSQHKGYHVPCLSKPRVFAHPSEGQKSPGASHPVPIAALRTKLPQNRRWSSAPVKYTSRAISVPSKCLAEPRCSPGDLTLFEAKFVTLKYMIQFSAFTENRFASRRRHLHGLGEVSLSSWMSRAGGSIWGS